MRNRTPSLAMLTVGLLAICVAPLVNAQTVSKILGADNATVADVVPANTAPSAAKKALVVTISPNSPTPSGSQDVNLIKVGGVAIALGQALMAASLPVTIASNQTAIAITSATLATEATLAALSAKFGTLGQKTMAGSAPVVIASDQSAIPVSGTVTPSVTAGTNATTTAVALTTTGTSVFSSTANVKARKIYNRSGNPTVYCVYYSGSNVTSEATASFAIAAGQTWEMPSYTGIVEYTGQINCATASSTGSVQALQVL